MKESSNNQGTGIPEGPLVMKGVIIEQSDLDSMDLIIRVNTVVRDPITGDTIYLENVELKQPNIAIPEPVVENSPCTVKCMSYSDLRQKLVSKMEVIPAERTPVVQNQAIPIDVKSELDSFSSRPSPYCKKMTVLERDAKKRMGIISDRDDITILQGRKNGRSPGIVIHQDNGLVSMFDKSGKQAITMDGQQVGIRASSIDMGNAKREHSSFAVGGLPSEENPVKDVLPQGPILSPHPNTIPSVTKIMNTVMPIIDMIDLITVCAKAVKEIQ